MVSSIVAILRRKPAVRLLVGKLEISLLKHESFEIRIETSQPLSQSAPTV
jgi:hypothetical protein